MPGRDIKFAVNNIYHIFNKTADNTCVFLEYSLTDLFLDLLFYYRSKKAFLRYSVFKEFEVEFKKEHLKLLKVKKFYLIDLYCFSIMPNHFHLLLKQSKQNGIPVFMSQILNSFTRFFNIKYSRVGSLFISPFKAVEIRSREQFIHTSRYIHLNHYSSGLIAKIEDIFTYPYTSLPDYMGLRNSDLINIKYLLSFFQNDPNKYKEFLVNQADYQRSLELIKHVEKLK